MTRILNLESYRQFLSYSYLYGENLGLSLPALPARKAWFDRFRSRDYLQDNRRPRTLSLDETSPTVKKIGEEIAGDLKTLYIVPDRVNSLDLRNLLSVGDSYVYQSAYHYWNHITEIQKYLNLNHLNHPIVFIDLDSFTEGSLCEVNLQVLSGSHYRIPILDNRRSSLQLPFNPSALYDEICENLALQILDSYFPAHSQNRDTMEHLKKYLQKIDIFSNVGEDVIVEILVENRIYYKAVNVQLSSLDFTRIIRSLTDLTETNPNLQFALIAPYNPILSTSLNQPNLWILDSCRSEFSRIWREKQNQPFPLFGQYLDRIEFQVGQGNNIQWVELLSIEEREHICYEGEPTRRVIGKIRGSDRNYFRSNLPKAILPIRINGEDYRVNDIPQVYQIKITDNSQEQLRIQIEISITPGSAPQLRVRDLDNERYLETELLDRDNDRGQAYISLDTIRQSRKDRANNLPSQYRLDNLLEALTRFLAIPPSFNLDQVFPFTNEIYKKIHKTGTGNRDLLLYLDPHNPTLREIRERIDQPHFNRLLEILFKNPQKSNQSDQNFKNKMERSAILTGKLYKFLNYPDLDKFFQPLSLKNGLRNIGSEYLRFLARVSINKQLQIAYFNHFSRNLSRKNGKQQSYYTYDQYLWGYSRILLWYSDFDFSLSEMNYREHFTLIIDHLHTLAVNTQTEEYRRNAFLALIYLLTFRERDPNFCTEDSPEYRNALRLIEGFRGQEIHLSSVISDQSDRSLNQHFEELLLGQSEGNLLDIP